MFFVFYNFMLLIVLVHHTSEKNTVLITPEHVTDSCCIGTVLVTLKVYKTSISKHKHL